MPRSTWLNILIILLVIIAAAYLAQLVWGFFSGFSDIILIVVLSWLVAYALGPIVDAMSGRSPFTRLVKIAKLDPDTGIGKRLVGYTVTRPLAVALVYLGLAILVLIAVASLIPTIVSQVDAIVPQLSRVDVLELALTDLFQGILFRLNIAYNIQDLVDSIFSSLNSLATPLLQNTVSILTSVLSLLGNALLVILLSFFFALDGEHFNKLLFEVVPQRLHQETRMFLFTTDRAFGGFLRGQILQAVAIGVGTGVILAVFGIQAALLSGVFAGVFMLIPLLGPILAFLPPLIAVLLFDPSKAFIVMITIALLQVIVVNAVMPRVMGNALGLHPLVIIVSLLIGVKVAGFWGAFFAMPLAGIISAFGAFLIRRRQRLAELTAAIVQDSPTENSPTLDSSLLHESDGNAKNTMSPKQKESSA